MPEHVAGSIGNQSCLRHRVFVRRVVRVAFFAGFKNALAILGTQQLEQLCEVVRLERPSYFLDLAESVWLDLQLNRVFRGMLQQGVARIEFEVAGDVAKANHYRTTEGMGLTVANERANRPYHASLVLRLHA